MQMRRHLPRLFRPSVYQGSGHPSGYFEGWYFKLLDSGGLQVWSVIPGVSYSNDPHSFIQVIHANSGQTFYQRYPVESFRYSRKEFHIEVGPNVFSLNRIELDLQMDELKMSGKLIPENPVPFPFKVTAPGIMGWYSYVPMMECYHGVVSMHHNLTGSLKINGSMIDFTGGRGYIEKDWGRSMPSDWIWIQSNHFDRDDRASFMISLARIPWLKGFFPGFLSFLYFGGKVHRFATYNRSRVEQLRVGPEEVCLRVVNRRHQLTIRAIRRDGGVLKAPRHGEMDREIRESIISTVILELKDRAGRVLFHDTGRFAGLEIVGDMEKYLAKKPFGRV